MSIWNLLLIGIGGGLLLALVLVVWAGCIVGKRLREVQPPARPAPDPEALSVATAAVTTLFRR